MGIYIEYPIGYTNLAPNRALFGIGSALSRLRDSTQSGTPFMCPIRYTICAEAEFYVTQIMNIVDSIEYIYCVPDRVHILCT